MSNEQLSDGWKHESQKFEAMERRHQGSCECCHVDFADLSPCPDCGQRLCEECAKFDHQDLCTKVPVDPDDGE